MINNLEARATRGAQRLKTAVVKAVEDYRSMQVCNVMGDDGWWSKMGMMTTDYGWWWLLGDDWWWLMMDDDDELSLLSSFCHRLIQLLLLLVCLQLVLAWSLAWRFVMLWWWYWEMIMLDDGSTEGIMMMTMMTRMIGDVMMMMVVIQTWKVNQRWRMMVKIRKINNLMTNLHDATKSIHEQNELMNNNHKVIPGISTGSVMGHESFGTGRISYWEPTFSSSTKSPTFGSIMTGRPTAFDCLRLCACVSRILRSLSNVCDMEE